VGPSEAVLRGLLAAAPDALLVVDATGTIVFVNDQAEKLFGWTAADLVGQLIECLVPPQFSGRHPSLRGGYAAYPTTRPMGAGLELCAIRKDGTQLPVEISLSGFTTSEGALVAAAIRDVTDTRRADEWFRAVLESAPDALVGVDSAGRIDLLNAQAERLFGWSAEDLLGREIEILVPTSALGSFARRQATHGIDPASRRTDVRDATVRTEIEADRQRQVLATQREQSHQLESLGQLAGGVAHDFNNLLGVILNYNTLVERRVTDPELLADLGEMRAAAERAAALTRQLLTFARRDVANPEALDVNEMVRGVAAMLDRTLGELIEFRLDLAEAPVVVLADRHQLEQIVLNLAINARDAMPSGGSLTISTRTSEVAEPRYDDQTRPAFDVVLEVIDTGEGMSPQVVSRAFEPFFTTKPRGEGTGLGLATVYGIVRQNGGEVTIRSAPGKGTAVRVVLRGVADLVPTNRAAAPPSVGGHEVILLVEDEAALRVATSRILTGQGYDVVVAADGIEALEVQERLGSTIDLVVTDVAMPRMGGVEFAGHLKDRSPATPIIFVSGFDSGDSPLDGRLLAKPVTEHDLLSAIREVLDG
jgi:PAS domain S-box-containing protein